MKKAVSICLLVLLAAAMFVSCADSRPPATSSPQPSAAPETPATPQVSSTPQVSEAPVDYLNHISIDYATEEFLSRYESYDQFVDPEAIEGSVVQLVISANIELRDFKFIEINSAADNHELWFSEEKVLYSVPTLSPEKPLVIGMTFFGDMPTRGISFTDESGTVRYYCIAMSGKDGSLLLVEF